jgi:hypothetical protein
VAQGEELTGVATDERVRREGGAGGGDLEPFAGLDAKP